MLWWLFGWGWKLWLIIIIIIALAIWIVYSRCRDLVTHFKDRYLTGDPDVNSTNESKPAHKILWPFQSRDPLAKTEDEILDRLEATEPGHRTFPNYPDHVPSKKTSGRQYTSFNETMYMNEGYIHTFDDYLDNQGFDTRPSNHQSRRPNVYVTEPVNPSKLRINQTGQLIDQYDDLTNRLNALKRDDMLNVNYSKNSTGCWNKDESTGETICRRVLEDLYQRPFPSIRPNFLKNPETGRNLELDGYCEELGIAFEYQGKQHYNFPNDFHRTEAEFMSQKRRDIYKAKACELAGIYLIPVPYHIPDQDIRQYIIDCLLNVTAR